MQWCTRRVTHSTACDVVYDRGRVRSACRGGKGSNVCQIGNVFHATQRVQNPFDGEQRGGQGNGEEPPCSSTRSKHNDVRWQFIRDLVGKKELKVVHVASEWQHTNKYHENATRNNVQTAP